MKKAVLLLVIVLAFILTGQSAANGEHWVPFVKASGKVYYYDKDSIIHESKGIVKVWIKITVPPEEREGFIAEQKRESPSINWEDFGDGKQLREIRCLNRETVARYEAYYDKSKKILWSGKVGDEWAPIIPGSLGESLYHILCPQKGKK